MRVGRFFGLASLMMAMALLCGCRVHPTTIAMTLVGDKIGDSDVEARMAGPRPGPRS